MPGPRLCGRVALGDRRVLADVVARSDIVVARSTARPGRIATRGVRTAPMPDAPQLESDLHRLTDALWAAVATVGGEPSAAVCRELGDEAAALRENQLPRAAFGAHVAK